MTPDSLLSEGERHFLLMGLNYSQKERFWELVTWGYKDIYQIVKPLVEELLDV